MKLIHYSNGPIKELYNRDQIDANQHHPPMKPKGLWVSVDGQYDWQSWCVSEGFQWKNLSCATKVILKPEANILYIRTVDEIDDATKRWGINLHSATRSIRFADYEQKTIYCLNWPEIAKLYDGMIISPYIWERRLASHTMWYYGWDCASGCIWNPSRAVADMRQLVLRNVAVRALGVGRFHYAQSILRQSVRLFARRDAAI